MHISRLILAVVATVCIASCGKQGDEKLADRVENAADKRADVLENQADMLDQQAEQIRKMGEQRGDAIDAANLDTKAMSKSQKDAIVANKAPAVR